MLSHYCKEYVHRLYVYNINSWHSVVTVCYYFLQTLFISNLCLPSSGLQLMKSYGKTKHLSVWLSICPVWMRKQSCTLRWAMHPSMHFFSWLSTHVTYGWPTYQVQEIESKSGRKELECSPILQLHRPVLFTMLKYLLHSGVQTSALHVVPVVKSPSCRTVAA